METSSPSRATVKQEMVDCEQDLLSLKAAIANLGNKKSALKTKLNGTSPFNAKMPVEIIAEIFYLVNESQDKQNTRLLPAPLFLGKICKAWRDIAWTTPRLWSLLSIHVDAQVSGRRTENKVKLLQEWLRRSGKIPLHICITFPTKTQPPDGIVTALLQACSQWKTFSSRPFRALQPQKRGEEEGPLQFPILSAVYLKGDRMDSFDPFQSCFSKAPKLQEVHLSTPNDTLKLETAVLQWEKLTVLKLDSPFLFDDAVAIIKKLMSIQKLHVQMERNPRNRINVPATPSNTPPNNLRDLSELRISSSGKAVCYLLNGITTPFLTRLEIGVHDLDAVSLDGCVEQLHRRSRFSLSHILLEGNIMEVDLITTLKPLSSLSSLSLSLGRKVYLTDETINLFNPWISDDFAFLPDLTEFNYKGSIGFSVKAIEAMIELRLILPALETLRNVNITYKNKSWTANQARANPNQLQAFYRKIQDLESQGATLKLVWDEKLDTNRPDYDSD